MFLCKKLGVSFVRFSADIVRTIQRKSKNHGGLKQFLKDFKVILKKNLPPSLWEIRFNRCPKASPAHLLTRVNVILMLLLKLQPHIIINFYLFQGLDKKLLHHIWTPEVDLLHAKATTQNTGIVFIDQKTIAYVTNGEVAEIIFF